MPGLRRVLESGLYGRLRAGRRRRPSPKPLASARGPFGSELIDTAVRGWQACETEFSESQHLMNDNARPKAHFSTVTTILEPSDCTLMSPGFILRLLAVSHHDGLDDVVKDLERD
jgi:hypothetical protein